MVKYFRKKGLFMKSSKKLICCAAVIAVLGVGATAAVAAQTRDDPVQPPVSDTVNDTVSSEESASKTPDVVSENTEIEAPPVIPEETAPEDNGEEEAKPETAVKQYLPTANAPTDFDYCSVSLPSDHYPFGGGVIVNTEPRSEVYAVSGGEVIFADYDMGSGNLIIIRYENGLYGLYAHFNIDGGMLVNKGDSVEAGQLIGLTGTTGDATQPSLCYRCVDGLSVSFLLRHPELA